MTFGDYLKKVASLAAERSQHGHFDLDYLMDQLMTALVDWHYVTKAGTTWQTIDQAKGWFKEIKVFAFDDPEAIKYYRNDESDYWNFLYDRKAGIIMFDTAMGGHYSALITLNAIYQGLEDVFTEENGDVKMLERGDAFYYTTNGWAITTGKDIELTEHEKAFFEGRKMKDFL